MRVMTFNIHAGVGMDGRLDLDRIASVIADAEPDVAALQEVDRHFATRSGFADQAEELSRLLGMRRSYGPAIDDPPPGPGLPRRQFGNAALSRTKILGRVNRVLPSTAAVERRALLRITVSVGGRNVDVYVTHLESRDRTQRSLQAGAVAAAMAQRAGTAVLLADLNAEPGASELMPLTAVVQDAWPAVARKGDLGRTFPAPAPARRIDVVLHTPGIVVTSARVPETLASDHSPVVVDIDV